MLAKQVTIMKFLYLVVIIFKSIHLKSFKMICSLLKLADLAASNKLVLFTSVLV